jgi:hypothetical protein
VTPQTFETTQDGPALLSYLLDGTEAWQRGFRLTQRTLRLFFCAMSREEWDWLEDPASRHAVCFGETLADTIIADKRHRAALDRQRRLARHYAAEAVGKSATVYENVSFPSVAAASVLPFSLLADYAPGVVSVFDSPGRVAELLRDIAGVPGMQRPSPPAWLTPDTRSLAEAAYEFRVSRKGNSDGALDPERLGVLSDACEESGCNDPVFLNLLRDGAVHYRGLWPLDLLLGKS